jgi:hypothetical protein
MRYFFRPKATGAGFVHPLISAPKTMILAPGFRETRGVRVFAKGWCEEAARFGPCAVAASFDELRRLARKRVELRHAVIVLTYSANSFLSDEDRDFLWDAFGVPVFEQHLGPNNELLATECEAHDGLHVVGPVGSVRLEKSVCGCGSTVPRLMPQWQPAQLESLVA